MWLRDKTFDLTFIVGVAILAVSSAQVSVANPKLFPLILFLDLWILGYHHVVSTFTRLSFDLESFKNNRFLVLGLPWLILGGTIAAAWILGFWIVASAYLYWQWFHYTRQNYGVLRGYARKVDPNNKTDLLEQLTVYVLPVYGILNRSYQDPSLFLGMPIKVFPVSLWLVQFFGALTVYVLLWWCVRQIFDFIQGRFRGVYCLYMMIHLLIFWMGYIYIENINYGWLCLNVWHNAQYIMFVWLFNNNRFKNGIDPKYRFISYLSQNKNVILYYAVCIAISTVIYMSIDSVSVWLSLKAVPLVVLLYQVINFHHYVVDGVIWKTRRKTKI